MITGSEAQLALQPPATSWATPLSADGAINPNTAANYLVTKAGVFAGTLAAPTAGVDDYKRIRVLSTTNNAHTVTATGLFGSGSSAVNLATFAAFSGAGFECMAFNAKWLILNSVGVTFS